MVRRAVFLDRDGVINRPMVRDGLPYPPGGLDELELLPGVPGALHDLKRAGFVLIVVTNQPDVARGSTPRALVEGINKILADALPIDRVFVCYHDSSSDCLCRKPRPGMLQAGALEFDIDLARSYMVGDRWRDIEAGINAGCATIFIDCGYTEKRPASFTHRAASLADAARYILEGPADHEDR